MQRSESSILILYQLERSESVAVRFGPEARVILQHLIKLRFSYPNTGNAFIILCLRSNLARISSGGKYQS